MDAALQQLLSSLPPPVARALATPHGMAAAISPENLVAQSVVAARAAAAAAATHGGAVTLAVAALTFLAAAVSWSLAAPRYVFSLPPDIEKRARAIAYPQYAGLPEGVLITGGCGFLGRNIAAALLSQARVKTVVLFDVVVGKFDDPRVVVVKGDLRDRAALERAIKDNNVTGVIHTASPHPNGTDVAVFKAVNVDGTAAALAAADAAGARVFVSTSSASVVWQGRDHAGVDEAVPYPATFRDAYSATKAEGERVVMAYGRAHGARLATVCLRPHAIFGPGDRQMVPTLIERAREGKDKWIIGDGRNVVDFTYIGNVVHAHLLALARGAAHIAKTGSGAGWAANGKTYFITNGEPRPFWGVLNAFMQGLGYRGGRFRLPAGLLKAGASAAAAVNDARAALAGGRAAPLTLSAARVEIVSTVHWYSIAAARADLGYAPLWPMDEGIFLTLKAFPELRNTDPPRDVVERARGAGLVALGLVPDTATAVRRGAVGAAGVDAAALPEYTAADVARHAAPDDMWVVIDGRVYDLTPHVPLHPCGPDKIAQHPGADVSKGFHGPQHPESVHGVLAQYLVGRLKG